MVKLNKNEMQAVERLFTSLCESEENLDRELEQEFGENGGRIRTELEEGVDRFYQLYGEDLDEGKIRKLLEEKTEGMTLKQQFSYLANVQTALTHVCGNILENGEWEEMARENQAVLSSLNSGILDEEDDLVADGVSRMLDLISANVNACGVLLIGEPPYEQLFSSCRTENLETVEALAVETRAGAVNMAAALYILQERGELPSLGETRFEAREMGVTAAAFLEIDGACKTGSWETAEKIMEKAAKTAAILLVTSPDLLKDAMFLLFVGLLTHFSLFWMLVSGAILLINLRIRQNTMEEQMEPVFRVGAKVTRTVLSGVWDTARAFSQWIHLRVLPRAIPVWEKGRDFTVNRILIPAAAWILKAKERAVQLSLEAVEGAERLLAWMKEKAGDFSARVRAYGSGEQEESREENVELDEEEEPVWEEEPSYDSEEPEILVD